MSIESNITQVARILGYQSESPIYLCKALTAPAGGGEGLADFGIDVIRSCLSFNAYEQNIQSSKGLEAPGRTINLTGTKGYIAERKDKLCTYAHLASVAQRTTIDRMIVYNPQFVEEGHIIVGKALAAIIAAAHLDCGRSYLRTWQILEYIGFFTEEDNGVNPSWLHTSINMDTHVPVALPEKGGNCAGAADMLGAMSIECQHNSSLYDIECTNGHPMPPAFSSVQQGSDVPNAVQESDRKRSADISFSKSGGDQRKAKQVRRQKDSPTESFLAQESIKCQENRLPTPQESYFTADIARAIERVDHKLSKDVLERLILGSGSAQSVLVVQEAIQTWRGRADLSYLQISNHSSKAQTYNNISLISQQITGLNLFRRYQISYLFEECGGCETPSLSGFVATPGYIVSGERRAGNPRNNAEAELTRAMMKQVLPHVKRESSEWRKGYKDVSNLRILARRFHILQGRFGRGILALIPYPLQSYQTGLELSDNMLLKVPESIFPQIVSILDHSQGDYLRELSKAAWKTIGTMLYQPRDFCPPFQLEIIEPSYILEQPKDLHTILPLLN
ncbi:hypothetical protein BDV38DRAFT_296745 [Aspergillus pseudotamarii]|uniref:RNase III domain-containing protein n=1 Tax=Aspergillus pseudotamarii TaxID=132259 RepID=A0A5N6T4J3_ASPPS|nr:uncharacterized protein BDV38DRAFT_296745 [Aspergillus pseudotamarii]KAE8141225.1 hypothetical protein BDV38DRAFT_296745 [Aspergillus pseudotamarii]